MARPNWSLRLARPLVIPKVMTLTTLADVRLLIAKHLPAQYQDKRAWRHVAAELDKAAAGGGVAEVLLALRMALSLEGVEWHLKMTQPRRFPLTVALDKKARAAKGSSGD